MFSERIRIQDFFIDFDKKRTGCVSKTQFVSAMSIAGFRLTAMETHELCEQYRGDVTDRPVRWRAFCDDVNEVFTTAHLEKSPTALVSNGSRKSLDCDPSRHTSVRSLSLKSDKSVSSFKSDRSLDRTVSELSGSVSAGRSDALETLLDALEERVRERNIDVAPLFRDHNRNPNSPKRVNGVTATQFASVLKTHIRLGVTEQETALLVEHFGDGSGMVNYARFAATVDPKPFGTPAKA